MWEPHRNIRITEVIKQVIVMKYLSEPICSISPRTDTITDLNFVMIMVFQFKFFFKDKAITIPTRNLHGFTCLSQRTVINWWPECAAWFSCRGQRVMLAQAFSNYCFHPPPRLWYNETTAWSCFSLSFIILSCADNRFTSEVNTSV